MQKLITRQQWGARYRRGWRDRPMPVKEFWLHHSDALRPDMLPPYTDDDAAIRQLERIGQSRFGGGISYTFPVTPVGRVYEGCGMEREGAHTLGHNTVGAAFCLTGDYTKTAPTAEQEEAIAQRMVIEHREGRASTHQLNGGHRDVYGTSCPGDAAYARIPAINARARELWAANYPAIDIPQEDDLMALTPRNPVTKQPSTADNWANSTWRYIIQNHFDLVAIKEQLGVKVEVDEEALATELLSSLGPQLRDAVIAAVATPSAGPEEIADRVVAKLGAQLTD